MIERRKSKRITITAVAEINSPDDQVMQKGYVYNISAHGIGVYIKEPFAINTRVDLNLTFYTQAGIKEVRWIAGKVKRVQPFSNVYSVGIEFDGLDLKKHEALISYIQDAPPKGSLPTDHRS